MLSLKADPLPEVSHNEANNDGCALGSSLNVISVATVLLVAMALGGCGNDKGMNRKSLDAECTDQSALNYKPPEEGIIQESDVSHPNKRTIIYIGDYHKDAVRINDFQRNIQSEIYAIVRDLIKDGCKPVPLVLETWAEGRTAEKYRNIFGKEHPLYKLYNKADRQERRSMAPSLLSDNSSAAGPVLVGVFQEEINPIGTVAETEYGKVDKLAETESRLFNLKRTGSKFCRGADNNLYDVGLVEAGFKSSPDEMTNTAHCYCALHNLDNEVTEGLRKRLSEIPVREVKAALDAGGVSSGGVADCGDTAGGGGTVDGRSTVVLIAGVKHLEAAIPAMKAANVNYYVVAPRTLAPTFEAEKKRDVFRPVYPDSPGGICQHLNEVNPAAAKAVMDEIMK